MEIRLPGAVAVTEIKQIQIELLAEVAALKKSGIDKPLLISLANNVHETLPGREKSQNG